MLGLDNGNSIGLGDRTAEINPNKEHQRHDYIEGFSCSILRECIYYSGEYYCPSATLACWVNLPIFFYHHANFTSMAE